MTESESDILKNKMERILLEVQALIKKEVADMKNNYDKLEFIMTTCLNITASHIGVLGRGSKGLVRYLAREYTDKLHATLFALIEEFPEHFKDENKDDKFDTEGKRTTGTGGT